MVRIRLAEKSAERLISSEEYSEEDVKAGTKEENIRKDGVSEMKGHKTNINWIEWERGS